MRAAAIFAHSVAYRVKTRAAPLSAKMVKRAVLKVIPGASRGMCPTLKIMVSKESPAFFR